MKKKMFILIVFSLISLITLVSCRDYKVGDTITKAGITYKLYDSSNLGENVYKEDSTDYISSYYYLDMTKENSYPDLTPITYTSRSSLTTDSISDVAPYRLDSAAYPYYNYNSTAYGFLTKTLFYTYGKKYGCDYFWCVIDVSDNNEITIPETLVNYSILAVGYNVINNKDIHNLTFLGDTILLPYSINNTNIKNLTFSKDVIMLSSTIANSKIETLNFNINLSLSDASIYNSEIVNLNISNIAIPYDLNIYLSAIPAPISYQNTTYYTFGIDYIFKPFFYKSKINNIKITDNSNINDNQITYIINYKNIYYLYQPDFFLTIFYIPSLNEVNEFILPYSLAPFNRVINNTISHYYLTDLLKQSSTIYYINKEEFKIIDNKLIQTGFIHPYVGLEKTYVVLDDISNYKLKDLEFIIPIM